MVEEKYKNYLYIETVPKESKYGPSYEQYGFDVMLNDMRCSCVLL